MKPQHAELLQDIIVNVMEQMAFMFAQPDDRIQTQVAEAEFVQADMIFHGPLEGCLTLVGSTRMCMELSANILGMEPEDEMARSTAIDAFKEILNVICGYVLSGIAGPEATFEMAPPRSRLLTPDEWDTLEMSPESLYFSVDDHPMLIHLAIEGA